MVFSLWKDSKESKSKPCDFQYSAEHAEVCQVLSVMTSSHENVKGGQGNV